jgi:hypothetical protein
MHPLMRLTKKGEPFLWTPECTKAIQMVKKIIQSDPVLHRPDYLKPFALEVNASRYALGAILYQHDERKRPLVVGHFSKTLIPMEQNYDVHDRKLLGLI